MPEIRITGTAPGQQPRGKMTPEQQDAAQRAYARSNDYAKAEAQRTAQETSEQRAYRARAQQDAVNQRKLDSLTRDEIKLREADLDTRRRAMRSHRSALQQEQRLQHRFENLQHRASKPLTPSSWNALQRAINTSEFHNTLFRQVHGKNAIPPSAFQHLRGSTADEATAFRTVHALRLGNIGARAGLERSWTELVRIERELKRIDKSVAKQTAVTTDPTKLAALRRVSDSIYTAKVRIAAGTEGNNRLMNAAGRGVGLFGLAMRNPIANGIIAGAMATAAEPYTSRRLYASVLALGRPYRDFKIGMGRLGLAGGYSGTSLADSLLPNANQVGIHTFVPGSDLAPELARYGLSPQDVQRYGQLYGIAQPRAADQVRLAESARMASLSPGMNLSEETLLKMGAQAQTLSGMRPEKYFQQLQKTMAVASAQGINSTQFASGLSNLIARAGSGGTPINIGGLQDWFARVALGGAPGARTGQLQNDYLSGVNQASENLGKGPDATTIAFSMYLSRRHPKSAEQMALQFGLKKKAFQQYASTPEGAEVVANLNLALKHGNGYAASRFAGQLLKNNPSLFTGLEQQAGIHDLLRGSPEMEDIARAAIEHTELGTSIGAHAGAAQGSLPSMGYAPGVPPQYLDFIAQIAKEKGVPLNEALALFATESGFRNVKNPNSSARGIGQITSGTAALYGYTAADMSAPDQKKNIIAAISYYAAARQQSKGNAIRARDYYHFGLGSNQTDAADETTFANYANQYSEMNNVLSTQATNAQQSTTQLTGSAIADKEVQSVSDAVQVAFRGVADAAHEVSQALHEAASAARDYTGTAKAPGGGYFSGGQYVPPAAVPHQQTVK